MASTSKPMGFFRDNHGRVAIWQWPNVPLFGWILFKIIALVAGEGHLAAGSAHLGTAFLFTWAYLEATTGAVYFRRALGCVVMAAIVINFFR